MTQPPRDRPWLIRTYSGHSTAEKSNELYRTNLARGQTGLSVAFDLPTQTGYDSDHPLAKGEVGKVGVPVAPSGRHAHAVRRHPARPDEHLDDDQRAGGVAAGALHRRSPRSRARRASELQGTTQNDIIKEYLSRGTYIFPPAPSLSSSPTRSRSRYREVPKWNPMNVCTYHLQEAGATPVQELAFSLANADRRARCGAARRPGAGRRISPQVRRPHQLLRQCRHPLRHRNVQDARLRRAVGRDRARTLRRHRRRSSAASATACR